MVSTQQEPSVFKRCPMCGFLWAEREGFLADSSVEIVGYQASFDDLVAGHLLFNHSCEGTLAVHVGEFVDLYDGPVFAKRMTGTDECPTYCLRREELKRCPVQCECAWVREVVQIVANWPKAPGVLL